MQPNIKINIKKKRIVIPPPQQERVTERGLGVEAVPGSFYCSSWVGHQQEETRNTGKHLNERVGLMLGFRDLCVRQLSKRSECKSLYPVYTAH